MKLFALPKLKKGRVPRKVKKAWKKDPYFCIFGRMWIQQYKINNCQKALEQYWGVRPITPAKENRGTRANTYAR